MGINPLDFSRYMQTPDYSSLANPFADYWKNYENAQTPKKIALEQALKQSEIEKNQLYSPFTGAAGNLYTLNKLKQNPNVRPEDLQAIQEQINLEQENTRSNISRRNQISEYQALMSLPSNDRANLIAKWRTIYDDEQRAIEAIVNKESFADAAKAAGFTDGEIKGLERTYAPTESTKTAIQTTMGAQAEAASLEDFVTKGMKNYSRKVMGYSPKQIMDSFKNNPKSNEEMSDFLAARALSMENAAARIRQAGLSDAEKIVKQMMDKSLNNVKAFEGLVGGEVYELTQQKITRELNKAADARITALRGQAQKPKSAHQKKVEKTGGQILNGLEGKEHDPFGIL